MHLVVASTKTIVDLKEDPTTGTAVKSLRQQVLQSARDTERHVMKAGSLARKLPLKYHQESLRGSLV